MERSKKVSVMIDKNCRLLYSVAECLRYRLSDGESA